MERIRFFQQNQGRGRQRKGKKKKERPQYSTPLPCQSIHSSFISIYIYFPPLLSANLKIQAEMIAGNGWFDSGNVASRQTATKNRE